MSGPPASARAGMVVCGLVLIVAGVLVMAGKTSLAAPLLLLGSGMATVLTFRRWPRE